MGAVCVCVCKGYLAPVERQLLGNALSNVDFVADAVHAHVGCVGRDDHTALTAQTARWFQCVCVRVCACESGVRTCAARSFRR